MVPYQRPLRNLVSVDFNLIDILIKNIGLKIDHFTLCQKALSENVKSLTSLELGIFFWIAKISNIFLGCMKFLIFFWGEGQMLGPSLRMQ